MHKRFLAYSLRHRRPIKVIWLQEGTIKTGNLQVVELLEDRFSYLSSRNRKKPRSICYRDILAASYARGDDGDLSRPLSPPAPPEKLSEQHPKRSPL